MNEGALPLNESLEPSNILQRIAQGDQDAVNDCINRHGNLVWCITRKRLSTKEDAEDAVQEIFIDIWKSASRFDGAKSPEEAFIALIAHRRVNDRLRNLYRRSLIASFENVSIKHANNAHKKLDKYLEVKPALAALSKLKLRQKQVIVMSVYDGMSHGEIAKKVGLPLGTVKTNIRRGLQKIRNSIESANPLPIQN